MKPVGSKLLIDIESIVNKQRRRINNASGFFSRGEPDASQYLGHPNLNIQSKDFLSNTI